MPYVVEQRRVLHQPRVQRVDLLERSSLPQQPDDAAGQMIYAERVIEPRVGRPWIHQVRQPELLDVPEPLEDRGIDDPNRGPVEFDRVPEGIAEDHSLDSYPLYFS